MSPQPLLLACGLALLGLASWIVTRQRRAADCPRHDRRAGALAMMLAAGCVVVGLLLLANGITP